MICEFREIRASDHLIAHQLGRFGIPTGAWRIEWRGGEVCECRSEADAAYVLALLSNLTVEQWANATGQAIDHLVGKEAA